jgi:hypothetical protein
VVEYNGVRSFGILDYSDGLEFLDQGGPVQTRVTTCLVVTSAFSDLRGDAVIVVGGTRYKIDRVSPQDDGATTLLYLKGST